MIKGSEMTVKCTKNQLSNQKCELSTPKLIKAMTKEIVLKLWSRFNVTEANCYILKRAN